MYVCVCVLSQWLPLLLGTCVNPSFLLFLFLFFEKSYLSENVNWV